MAKIFLINVISKYFFDVYKKIKVFSEMDKLFDKWTKRRLTE